MRAFVTGATGFIGGTLVRRLLADGWDVTALVRTPARARALADAGVALHAGDVTDTASVEAGVKGHDVVFHLAAWYALGARDRTRMEAVNVAGTQTVLRAAVDAAVPRIVYCSSTTALGFNPPGAIGDESKIHEPMFGSIYEETKHRAHERVRVMVAAGAPVVTVLPCAVYGPGDGSLMGTLIRWYAKRLLLVLPFADAEVSFVHVDDVAAGIAAAAERGTPGDYILGGDNDAIAGLFRRAEPVTGIRAPRANMSVRAASWFTWTGPLAAKLMRQERDFFRDALANVRGSGMYSSAKAARDLGYTFRDAPTGLADTVLALRARR